MKILKISLALFIGIATLIALIFILQPKKSPAQLLPIIVGQKKIDVELADTASKRYKGLSGRSALAQDQGMFFIFEKPDFYAFTMRKMNFPIDIIWIDADQTIIQINSNIRPNSYPQNFKPASPAKYVLEMNSGWALKNNIKIKDSVVFLWQKYYLEDLIYLDSPQANEKIKSPLIIKGQARGGWFFEATFPMRLEDSTGHILVQNFARTQENWMTADFVPFEGQLEFSETSGDIWLVLEKDNPSGLPEQAKEFRVLLRSN